MKYILIVPRENANFCPNCGASEITRTFYPDEDKSAWHCQKCGVKLQYMQILSSK